MKLALVTTPPSVRSGLADRVRGLVQLLARELEVRIFVEPGREGEPVAGVPTESALALLPREHDQILYEVENAPEHGFMAHLMRELGGIAALYEWELPELAKAAFPALTRGGFGGRVAAWREGGPLNRSIVRWADGFLVPDEALGRQILVDRNAHTPIVVVPAPSDHAAVAELYLDALRNFPRPRAARKRMFWRRVRLAMSEREGAR